MNRTDNVLKVKALMRTVPREVISAIGGPMLLGLLKQMDSLVKGAERLSQVSLKKFKEDPLAALTLFETVVKDTGVISSEKKEEEDDDTPAVSANEKLQVIYSRSLEYAAAHDGIAQACENYHSVLSFLCMVSATATSLLLFSSSNTSNDEASETAETSDTTGQTWGSLAASITTTLTVIKEALKLSSLSNKHYDSSVDYLGLVHQIRYSLLTDTEDKQEVEYQDYSARFYHIRQQSSALPLPRILDTFLSAAKEGGQVCLFEVTWDDDVKFARYARMLFPNDRTGRPRLSQTVAATVLGYIFDNGPFCGLDFKKWIEKFVYGMFQKDFKGIPRGDGGGLPKTRNRVYPVKPVFDMLHPILPTTKHDIPDEGKDDGIDNMGEEESETEGPPRGSPPVVLEELRVHATQTARRLGCIEAATNSIK